MQRHAIYPPRAALRRRFAEHRRANHRTRSCDMAGTTVQRAASPIYEEAWLQPRVLKRCSMGTVCSGYSSCALGKLEGHPQHRSGPNRAPSGRWARLPDPSAKHGAGRASSQRAACRRDMRPGTCPLPPRDSPTSAPRDSPTSAPAMCDLRAQTSPARAVGGAHAPDRRSAAEEQMHPWHGTVLGGAPGYSGVLRVLTLRMVLRYCP